MIFLFFKIFLQVLRDDFKSELSGHYEDICLALMDPPEVYDCKELNRAVKVSHCIWK